MIRDRGGPPGGSIADPPIARALFGETRWAWVWVVPRLYVGAAGVEAGWAKWHSPGLDRNGRGHRPEPIRDWGVGQDGTAASRRAVVVRTHASSRTSSSHTHGSGAISSAQAPLSPRLPSAAPRVAGSPRRGGARASHRWAHAYEWG